MHMSLFQLHVFRQVLKPSNHRGKRSAIERPFMAVLEEMGSCICKIVNLDIGITV